MHDVIENISSWINKNQVVVVATVIKTWGSGPRKVGSGMVIGPGGEIAGSVSGGCVEGDVVKQSDEVRNTGISKIIHYGITDDEAWEVGLSCGGQIDILLEQITSKKCESWLELQQCIITNKGCILASPLYKDAQPLLIKANESDIHSELEKIAFEAYEQRRSTVASIEGVEYFVNVFPKKSQLIIIGAAHISSELVELASMHGFETIVIDPRGLFSGGTQFNVKPDQAHQKWPAEVLESMNLNSDVFATLLTHDPKIDDQALHILLKSGVSYIGALGSRKTHQKRTGRLKSAGFSDEEIARIHAPIGVDINAKSPREIALSVVSELVSVRNQYL
ncbi:MAG: XdhC family protein [Bacteroidetes bacterium]|nr:XdhC family protein [Bacteroidota bacterium]MDA1121964.1 XdhC family protein [Bacteroidota bacterium]